MSGERFTLDPNFKALLYDLRVSPARVLRRASLPGDLLSRGPVALLPEEYFRFWDALDAEGGDPNLPVRIGQAISVEMFNPPIFAALCSPDLETAAQRIATYKPLIGPMHLGVEQNSKGLRISYHWPAGMRPPQLLAMSELVFWAALARIGTRHNVRPTRISVPQLPEAPDVVGDFLGARVRKEAAHAITFATVDATRPFVTENEQMWRFFAPELRRRLSDLEGAASITDRVRAALHETLPAGDPSMTAVARRLAVSSRTLQRQLHLEGATFQVILARTREDLARHYLGHGAMSPAEIAYLLGYDDTNSFYRAFRTWTGTTPQALRSAGTG
ncbi:AraC family transcriptional regulator ligand-binding domain-containing protein [Dactylosporangium sp. NPDC049140]|uniref:AraC family transcriptional regulator n=1 Tax=Dactylosporangium sp. NPDC049140 TaxID=3155647 RepID=UPI0033C2E99E